MADAAGTKARLSVDPLEPFGVRVGGLREGDLADEVVLAQLRALWRENGLVVFRNCDATPAMQVGISGLFGELLRHPIPEVWVDGHPELVAFRTGPDDEYVYDVGGVERAGWIPWHSDQSFMPTKNRGGMLRLVVPPAEGGETAFMDSIALYASLPADLRERIARLEVVYRLCPDMARQPFATFEPARLVKQSRVNLSINERIEADYPPVVHPMVLHHPETGLPALNFSPNYALHVLDMPRDEGDALLRRISAHIFENGQPYVHRWNADEMVLWDNWRTLHMALGTPPGERREVHRTTIAGDYRWGRLLQAQ